VGNLWLAHRRRSGARHRGSRLTVAAVVRNSQPNRYLILTRALRFGTGAGPSWRFGMYIGPDAIMPLASALAAIGGVIMLFWRRFVGFTRLMFQRVARVFSKAR